MLSIDNVVRRFDAHVAVDGASLTLTDGEVVALLGPSGCGKTTLLRMIAGFERLDGGAIAMNGTDLTRLPPSLRNIGLVFQDYALFPHMTVARNIEYGMRRRGVPRPEREARVAAMLALVQLTGVDARRPSALSGGQQQRVALARALATQPGLLLLDEPLSNLDAKLRIELGAELHAILRKAKTTTLIVTHDQAEAMTLGDRIAIMAAGRILQTGAPAELYRRPASRFVAEFLGRCNWLDGEVAWNGDGPHVFRTGNVILLVSGARRYGRLGCMIRPEAIQPVLSGVPESPNARTMRIEQINFLGQDCLVRLSGPGISLLAAMRPQHCAAVAPGDALRIDIAPEDCQLIAADD